MLAPRIRTGTPAVALTLIAGISSAVLVWALFVRDVSPLDLRVFLHAARTVAHGASPYVPDGSSRLWSGNAYVYPYFAAWLFAPLSVLPAPTAGLMYYALSVGAVMMTVRLLYGSANPAVVVAAISAEPVVRGLQLGTVNAWLLLGLAVAWRFRRRTVVVVAALTVVIVVKLFLLPMIFWLLATRRFSAAALTTVASTAVVGLGCSVAGMGIGEFVRMLSTLSAHEASHSSSVAAVLSGLGAPHPAVTLGPFAVAATILVAAEVRRRRSGSEAGLFIACVLASIAASPIVWSHYYTLLLVVPLIFRWRVRTQILAAGSTWFLGVPAGGTVLAVLHPFPLSGWLWVAIVAVVVGRRRFVSSVGPMRRRLHRPDPEVPEAEERDGQDRFSAAVRR